MGILYGVVRAGHMAVVADDVENVTGRRPLSLEHLVRDNIACWQ